MESAPPRVSSAGLEAVELAASAGLVLDDWQQHCLIEALGEKPGGKWAAFEVGLVVPRQNGKGSVLEARELAGLFLFNEQLILHSAHEFKTAQEAFRRILQLVENTDDLRKRVHRIRTSHGEEGIELLSGARLRFVARSTGSGRGFSGDCVILDEAFKLPAEALGALLPTLSARPNPQLWYTSSAGHSDSEVLRAVRDRGTSGGGGLCYLEWSADPSADPDSESSWVAANPALGIRITRDHVQLERDAMPEGEFLRERLGIWDDPAGASHALDAEAWLASADRDSQISGPICIGVDVSPEGRSSIAVAAERLDGMVHVELVENRPGVAWVAPKVLDMIERWSPIRVTLDASSPAAAMLPDLERDGNIITKVSGRELAASAVAFSNMISENKIRHIDQPALSTAVAGAKRRDVGDSWAFGRKHSSVDISPVVAAALAAWSHLQTSGRNPKIIDIWSDNEEGIEPDLHS